jgi:hypothetical protein
MLEGNSPLMVELGPQGARSPIPKKKLPAREKKKRKQYAKSA